MYMLKVVALAQPVRSTTSSRGTTTAGKTVGTPKVATKQLLFCTAKPCKKQGSEKVLEYAKGLKAQGIEVCNSQCLGNCSKGPSVKVHTGAVIPSVATPSAVDEVVRKYYRR